MTNVRKPRQTRAQWKRIIDQYNAQQQEASEFCNERIGKNRGQTTVLH